MSSFLPFAGGEEGRMSEYHQWKYINLSDFRSTGIGSVLSYIWLWILAIISVSVYAADTFTAVNLLAFNKWSSEFQPKIPLDIAKWIFAGCILFSWVLCAYEWFQAWRTMRKNSVAKDYLDPTAVTFQSLRVFGTKGQGWRRFLVFAELTKSKKGADYVALFAYFQFKGAIRILLAEGPRQGVNALTLFSFMFAKLNGKDAGSDIVQFWDNMKLLAAEHREQAVILWTMAFTFIIWLFSLISFIVACFAYVFFLWHWIPSSDGSLRRYCRRKIEKRLERIVSDKVGKAIEKQNKKLAREEQKQLKAGFTKPELVRAPTLPSLLGQDDDASSIASTLTRQTTQTTLPAYRPPTRTESKEPLIAEPKLPEPTLPKLADIPTRPQPSRTTTDNSLASNGSDRPLLSGAAPPGVAGRIDRRPLPSARNPMPSSQPSYSSQRSYSSQLSRQQTPGWTQSPESYHDEEPQGSYFQSRPPMQPQRSMTSDTFQSARPPPRPATTTPVGMQGRRMPPRAYTRAPEPQYYPEEQHQAAQQSYEMQPRRGVDAPFPTNQGRPMPEYSSPAYTPLAAPQAAPQRPMRPDMTPGFGGNPRPPRRADTEPYPVRRAGPYDAPSASPYESRALQGPPNAWGQQRPRMGSPGPGMNGARMI